MYFDLEGDEKIEFMDALLRYGGKGIEPDKEDKWLYRIFKVIMPSIDKQKDNYEKKRNSGRKKDFEDEVYFRLFDEGLTNKEVMERLSMSESTVKNYRREWKKQNEEPEDISISNSISNTYTIKDKDKEKDKDNDFNCLFLTPTNDGSEIDNNFFNPEEDAMQEVYIDKATGARLTREQWEEAFKKQTAPQQWTQRQLDSIWEGTYKVVDEDTGEIID